jgi:hypothetical protein
MQAAAQSLLFRIGWSVVVLADRPAAGAAVKIEIAYFCRGWPGIGGGC